MTGPARPQGERPVARVTATWRGEHRFETGSDGVPTTILDGSNMAGQSPPEILLSALAACAGIDLVDILAKRRTPVESLTIAVEGARRVTQPRRFEEIRLVFDVTGAGIERVHAERAVQLAFERYCTVASSLAHDIIVDTIVVLNGERGSAVRQPLTG